MSATLENERCLRSYLLGDLDPSERQDVEQSVMTDSATFDELLLVEDELIDSYLENSLSEEDKRKFENFFLLAPERRQQMDFALALRRYVAEHKAAMDHPVAARESSQPAGSGRIPLLKWALAAALLLLVAGGSWATLHISRLQAALDQSENRESEKRLVEMQNRSSELASALQQEQARLRKLEEETAELRSGTTRSASPLLRGQLQSALISVTLAPGLLRDMNGVPKIRVPAGTDLAQFDLKMEPQDYPQYQATLQRIDEDTFWTQISPGMKSGIQGQPLGVIVPAHLLQPGDYILKLSGVPAAGDAESVGNYYFRIVPR